MNIKDVFVSRKIIEPTAKLIVTPYTKDNKILCRFESPNESDKELRKFETLVPKTKLILLRLFCNFKHFEVRTMFWKVTREFYVYTGPIAGVYREAGVDWKKKDFGRKFPINK